MEAIVFVGIFVAIVIALMVRSGRDDEVIEPFGSTKNRTPVARPRRTAQSARHNKNSTQRPSKWPCTPPDVPVSRELSGKCHVIDGDTIVIRGRKIRLAGIDAPELDQPYGQKSKWAMIHLCKGQTITARLNGETSHDRLVGTCHLPDGRDIGAELIKQGLAVDWPMFSGGKYHHLEPRGIRYKLNRPPYDGKAMPVREA